MPQIHTPVNCTVSVIIPTHNRLASLKRAIDSVLKQRYRVHEIIIVDDGSDDGTEQWLENQRAPVQYIAQENHGVSHARNQGIAQASGTWIALLDSDDYWHCDKLSVQMQALVRQPDSRLCHCDEIWIRNGKRVNQKNKHRKQGGYIFEQCLPLCAISPSAVVLHRDIFTTYGVFDESLPACEDYDLWLRITAHEAVTFVDQALLTKTGGHQDQLSSRYPIMDRYRLQSLAKLIRSGTLDEHQRLLASTVFLNKLTIVSNGACKRGNDQLAQHLASEYADLLSSDNTYSSQ